MVNCASWWVAGLERHLTEDGFWGSLLTRRGWAQSRCASQGLVLKSCSTAAPVKREKLNKSIPARLICFSFVILTLVFGNTKH